MKTRTGGRAVDSPIYRTVHTVFVLKAYNAYPRQTQLREKPVAFEKDKRIPKTTSEFNNDVQKHRCFAIYTMQI